jgi:DNA-binding transcriptional LysR family regulator
MLDWSDYRVVLALARDKTLSAAGRRLGVDQSTMGRRLVALEKTAGARLFDRTPEGFALTAAGEAVLPSLERIEAAAMSVEQKLVGHDARLEGIVRLATSDSFAAWFLVSRLAAFRERHPGIAIELVTGNPPVDLARREADLSLRLSRPTQPNLVARRLGRGAWGLYAAESYLARRGVPAVRRRLAGHDVVAFGDELRGTIGARWLADHGAEGRVVLASNSLVSHGAAVAAGLGVSPLPCVFADEQPGLCRLPPGLVGHHDIWLVVHPDVRSSARVRAVMDELGKIVQREAALLGGRRGRTTRRR